MGFIGVLLVGVFASGYPTGVAGVETSLLGQAVGVAALFPLAFLSGYIISGILKQFNMLRVPAEVELEGLDIAEYGGDFFPEFGMADEMIVNADGSEELAAPVLLAAFHDLKST